MSKTVDELEELFDEEFRKHPAFRRQGKRAGIIAIVRALRDEMASGTAWHALNEILGDAGEKVGTHGSPELDEDARKLEAMGQDPGMTLEELLAPATAPAPAVCEWVKGETGGVRPSCSDIYEYAPYVAREGVCPECKAPIKFTEEK